jgi:hypothetical protein
MVEPNRTAYNDLLKRTDVGSKQDILPPKKIARDSETKDPDRTGYYELLRKVQRSKDSTSLKSTKRLMGQK